MCCSCRDPGSVPNTHMDWLKTIYNSSPRGSSASAFCKYLHLCIPPHTHNLNLWNNNKNKCLEKWETRAWDIAQCYLYVPQCSSGASCPVCMSCTFSLQRKAEEKRHKMRREYVSHNEMTLLLRGRGVCVSWEGRECVCVCVCPRPQRPEKGIGFPWKWSYRQLWAAHHKW